jgi:RHS repeat-associated protein
LAASYRYDPFGNLLSSSGTMAAANMYRFSSKEINADSGMYYFGYRFYDPSLQRWLNTDPLGDIASLPIMVAFIAPGFEPGDVGSMSERQFLNAWVEINRNVYACVGNNPMLFIDPNGLSFWGDFGNGLNNTVSGIGQSMGQGLYDLLHWQWSQDEYNRIANMMYSMDTPDNPAATPYIEGAFCVSTAAATIAGGAMVAGADPWVGDIAYHSAHAGGPHQWPHIQIMIRTGLSITRHIHFRLWW